MERKIYFEVCRRVDLVSLAFDIIQSTPSEWDAHVKEVVFLFLFSPLIF